MGKNNACNQELFDRLAACGNPWTNERAWQEREVEYVERLELSTDHVEDLIEIARLWIDEAYWEDRNELNRNDPRWKTPVHAARALAELGDPRAAEPLVAMIGPLDKNFDDWLTEGFTHLLGRLGPSTITPLRTLLDDRQSDRLWKRNAAAIALRHLAEQHSDRRDEVIAILTEKLQRAEAEHPEVNAFVIDSLIELKVVDAAPLIEKTYAADQVDIGVLGDWQSARYYLGLGSEPPRRQPIWLPPEVVDRPRVDNRSQFRKKKKQQRKNKKKNRR